MQKIRKRIKNEIYNDRQCFFFETSLTDTQLEFFREKIVNEYENYIEELKQQIKIHIKGNSKILAKSCSLSYENEQLKNQIEKMKCCDNCRYVSDCYVIPYESFGVLCNKWELEE